MTELIQNIHCQEFQRETREGECEEMIPGNSLWVSKDPPQFPPLDISKQWVQRGPKGLPRETKDSIHIGMRMAQDFKV